MGALARLGAVPQAVPPQVVADSPLAGEGSWVQPDRETLLTRLERVYAAGDGTGYCFLEFPGQRGSALEGQFFAQPPEVRLAEPDSETFLRNQAFETERLRDW